MNSAAFAPVNRLGASAREDIVWRQLASELGMLGRNWRELHPVYRVNASRIMASPKMPTGNELNEWLEPSGWRVVPAHGYVAIDVYQRQLADGIFPVAGIVRDLSNSDHSAAPDFIHDSIGHLPMLFHQDYGDLIREWAKLGLGAPASPADKAIAVALADLTEAKLEAKPNRQMIVALTERLTDAHATARAQASRCFQFENFFTWAIEFGIIRGAAQTDHSVFGAAILSSPGELRNLVDGRVKLEPFNQTSTLRPVDYTSYQTCMFVADDFAQYFSILRSI